VADPWLADGLARILVVDDDVALLALIRLMLTKHGLAVEAAATAAEGLTLVDAFQPDLVVLDVDLPDLSGWEVLRRVREKSNVPVMLMSDRHSRVAKARGLDLGADDYVTKPLDLLEVEARVRALLRRAPASARGHDSPTGDELDGTGLTVAIIAERRHLGDQALRGTSHG